MPPRFAYWTIIVGGKPTAFRAQQRDELLPTFKQLQAKHPDASMMWFARGKLWSSPDDVRAAERRGGSERRKPEWRPGGEHRDPRARFDIPRDEKRRRFAAKLRRDDRGAGGAVPARQGGKRFPDRPAGGGPHQPREGRAPGPGSTPRDDRDRAGKPPGRPPFRDRPGPPPREGDRGPAPQRSAWKPGPPREGGGRPQDRRPAREGDRGPALQRSPWKPGPPREGGGRPQDRRPACEGDRQASRPEWTRDRSGGQSAAKPSEWRPKPPDWKPGPPPGGGPGTGPRGPSGGRPPGGRPPGGRPPAGKPHGFRPGGPQARRDGFRPGPGHRGGGRKPGGGGGRGGGQPR